MRTVRALALLTFAGLALPFFHGSVAAAEAATPPVHQRTPDQTFLTFPEWYLVHSPAEYAAYLGSGRPPSAFPLFAHIGQFWQGYRAVGRELGPYPFNGGYHLMVMVIGTSTTVEYALKGAYEHTVGRLAEATRSGPAPVPEEAFAARYAQAYVDFIRVDPWYLFDFGAELRRLWAQGLPLSGPDLIRRWERRFALSTELLVKAGYAHAIQLGTHAIYDAPLPVTAVVLSGAPARDAAHPDYAPLEAGAAGVLATIPRYEGFTAYSRWLAGQGIDFREIAGNRGVVVVSLLVPASWSQPEPQARVLFVQPILTRPGTVRVVLATPIGRLGGLLRQVESGLGGSAIEHVYDF
jgi:hypothetical protein